MAKELILGMGQKVYKMSLDHLVVPESNEVLKRKNKNKNNDGQRDMEPTERDPMTKSGTIRTTK